MMNGQTVLIMPDGVEIISTGQGFQCPQLPALAKVLDFLYPIHINPRVAAEQVGRRYGWRIQRAIQAVDTQYRNYEGVGM